MSESPRNSLPKLGMTQTEIDGYLSRIEMREPYAHFARAFRGPQDVRELGKEVFVRFMSDNGFFSLYLPYMQVVEQNVIDMGLSLLHPENDSAGNFTSGGTESNFSALHAAREWARVDKRRTSRPNVVVPRTIHPSFQKAAHYLDIDVITTDVREDGRAIPDKIRAAVNENTIMLAASAPSWAYANIDPIEEIAALAERRQLWMHVDGCIGAYLSPFLERLGHKLPPWDFRVPGVMSISGDLHKFAYCPKPASTIFWRHQEYQNFHYASIDDPYFGPYKMAGFSGSRSAGSIFAAWAVMSYLGEEGYLRLTRRLLELKQRFADGLARIEGLRLWEVDVMPLHFHSIAAPTTAIYHGMCERGWVMLGLVHPEALTLPIDPGVTDEMADRFLAELKDVTEEIIATGDGSMKGNIRYS